jgi:hypothetical protein
MSTRLPYFKFHPNEWENGNIQMCSGEDQSLFINLCCMYWSRLGNLPKKLVIQKLCGGNAVALNSLCEEKIIAILDDNIRIKFLDEQLAEFEIISNKNSDNAKSGWKKRREQKGLVGVSGGNAVASNSQSKNDANKRREDKSKIREDNIKERKLKFASTLNPFLEKYGNEFLNDFFSYWTEENKQKTKFRQEMEKAWDLKRRLENWQRNNQKFTKNNNPSEKPVIGRMTQEVAENNFMKFANVKIQGDGE